MHQHKFQLTVKLVNIKRILIFMDSIWLNENRSADEIIVSHFIRVNCPRNQCELISHLAGDLIRLGYSVNGDVNDCMKFVVTKRIKHRIGVNERLVDVVDRPTFVVHIPRPCNRNEETGKVQATHCAKLSAAGFIRQSMPAPKHPASSAFASGDK